MCEYRCRTLVGEVAAQRGRCSLDFPAWLECRVGDEGAVTVGERRTQTGESGMPTPKGARCCRAGASDPSPFQYWRRTSPFSVFTQCQVENEEARVIRLPGNDAVNVFSPKSSHQP
jgi:hypothetical protein